MRIVLVSAALAMTAACVMQPPPQQAVAPPPPGPVALAPAPAAPMPPPPPGAAPVAGTPAAPEQVATGPVPQVRGPLSTVPVTYLSSLTLPALRLMPPEPLRLALTNIAYDGARVQVLTTPYPDCLAREGTTLGEFVLPLNGTRVFNVPAGIDVCWRRVDAPPPGQGRPPVAQAPDWNRAYLTSGHSIDARL